MKNVGNRYTHGQHQFAKYVGHFLIPIVILLVVPMNLHAQTLHALLVIRDADPDVGPAMTINQKAVEYLLKQVEEAVGLEVRTHTLFNPEYRVLERELRERLDTTKIGDKDCLFVYFSGPGGFIIQTNTEFISLEDGTIFPSKIGEKIRDVRCRLKILITDRCNAMLEPPGETSDHLHATSATLRALFEKHEGFLHLTSATDEEQGWADATTGGLFTHALLHTIHSADTGSEAVASWKAIFEKTREKVKTDLERALHNLEDATKPDLSNKRILHQTPKAYSLPMLTESPPGLWERKNPDADFTVDIKTDQADYLVGEFLTYEVQVTVEAYIFILNWNTNDDFQIIFPNRYDEKNRLAPNKSYTIPPKEGSYAFLATAPLGIERIKILAFRNAADSKAVAKLIGFNDENPQKHQSLHIEAAVLERLQQINERDWAEHSATVTVSDNFREPDDSSEDSDSRHPNPVDIVYFKEGEDGRYGYLAQLIDPHNQGAAEVDVHIFNDALREKYGETLPQEWIITARTEPKDGWGHKLIMLSFYRDEQWIFTTDVVVYEDHYLLPKRLNGTEERVEGSREVGFGDVRIPIIVSFEQ